MVPLNLKNSSRFYKLGKITSYGERRKESLIKCIFDYFLNLPKSAAILEIGPGRGEFAEEAVKRGFQYVGIEPSQSLSEELRNKKIRVINESVPPINFPDNYFDVVYSFDVLEHFQGYPSVLDFLKESKRVVKEGGRICIIAPNYSTLGTLFFEYDYQHSFITTQGRIKRMFLDIGLCVTHQQEFLIKPQKGLFSFIDRLLACALIPIVRMSFVAMICKIFKLDNFLFKVRKNLFDHIVIIGQKKQQKDKK